MLSGQHLKHLHIQDRSEFWA